MTEIKNIHGEVIFTSANPDDTFKESVEQAVEANVSLMKADLQGADLKLADLREANLVGAELVRADLKGADLQGADLRGADLREANLVGANLHNAKIQMGNRVFVLKEEGTDETA
jgi:uncharacterized protein YjbI with pentapeptide repeats